MVSESPIGGETMAEAKNWIGGLIGVLVCVLIALTLLPTFDTAIVDANQSGASGALIALIPLLVAVGVLVLMIGWAVGHARNAF